MHPNPTFHTATDQENLAFVRERGFGILAINSESGPLMSHVPFLVSDDGKTVDLHLVRSNPIARSLSDPMAARIAVSGADTYVSPDWYEVPDQVPTWNYVAVHLTGMLELRPAEELRDLLDRQSYFFEQRLLPKIPWTRDKMQAGILDKMMRMIVPCKMAVTGIDGTWKLGQNKPDAVRNAAAEQISTHGIGSEVDILATLMRDA